MDSANCIERKYIGGTDYVNFHEFQSVIVQDETVAAEIARKMLNGDIPYSYGIGAETHEFYEEFTITDREALEHQLANWEAE